MFPLAEFVAPGMIELRAAQAFRVFGEKICAIVPFAKTIRRRLASKIGRGRGATARMPETPSTITSRASPSVSATSAIRSPGVRASSSTHSAPARVLPAPRPPIISQHRQSPSGGTCAGRRVSIQADASRSFSRAGRAFSKSSSVSAA